MFDLKTEDKSLSDLFYDAGIETISVDYEQSDSYETLLSKLNQLVFEYNPDLIFGYCYGCSLAVAIANKHKKIALLDPSCPSVKPIKTNNDEIYKQDVFDTLSHDVHYIKDLNAFVNSLSDTDRFKINLNIKERFPRVNLGIPNQVLILFSEYGIKNTVVDTDRGMKVKFIKNKEIKVIQDSSHFIIIEPARFQLFDAIMEFIDA